MVICGSHMHKFSANEDMKKKINNDKRRRDMHGSREGGGTFMSNTDYQRIEI
jgi:hypothetical protein